MSPKKGHRSAWEKNLVFEKMSSIIYYLSLKLEIWTYIKTFKDETPRTTDLKDLLEK